MINTILFDLDNTLLGNDMDDFLPPYFALCGQFADRHLPRDAFTENLLRASRTMVENTDPARTNSDVFWERFGELTGVDSRTVAAEFDNFYRHEFHQLQGVTRFTPDASALMDFCVELGLQVVIATNPMFPRLAIEARLAWAGVPVSKYPYALVTTMENMHATKPHAAYYREIMDRVGCLPAQTLMVGDDIERDIEPAAKLGFFTYWIQLPGAERPASIMPDGQGTLQDLARRLIDGWLLPADRIA